MNHPNFCFFLKDLRRKRGFSQLDLSLEAQISQKHVSFLETGRSTPSKDMLHRLSDVFDLSLHESNKFFLSAGFAAPYANSSIEDPNNSELKSAVEQIIQNHLPNPAMVFDHLHNVLYMNETALALNLELYNVNSLNDLPAFAVNLVEGLFHPDGYGKFVTNFDEVASFMFRRLLDEISQIGDSENSRQLLKRISTYESFIALDKNKIIKPTAFPSLTINLKKGYKEYCFYTAVSSFGAPFDVTIQNLRIELFFPLSN